MSKTSCNKSYNLSLIAALNVNISTCHTGINGNPVAGWTIVCAILVQWHGLKLPVLVNRGKHFDEFGYVNDGALRRKLLLYLFIFVPHYIKGFLIFCRKLNR